MHMSICLADLKVVCKPATTRREETIDILPSDGNLEETNAGTTQMTALVKGSTC